jgi:hypothetical protein
VNEYSSTSHLSKFWMIVTAIAYQKLVQLLLSSSCAVSTILLWYLHSRCGKIGYGLLLEMNWAVKILSFIYNYEIALLIIVFELQYSESDFDGTKQYARNKRVQVCEPYVWIFCTRSPQEFVKLTWSCKRPQVALTEWWAEKYGNKGVGFYCMHPGWADTPGVAKSLPGLSEKYVFSCPNSLSLSIYLM